ncbi:multiple epidermal growth factor-like domains 10 [Elysia marginata]|uniref:Multiple epidermal growth factor-like domains 10 n=1 Tax=Elysia marginata TaxID=1093978 RepID=A0AAV4FBQ2_9GAST|nr:multiple epidermal growth factor-like domains 10 [Elysia marginata]
MADECCNVRLANFKLTALSGASTDTIFTYDEPGTTQALYTVVPSPRISFPVSQVRFDLVSTNAILTLCEVLVYGETSCPAGRFGLACERQCNCANGGSCFIYSGGCPSGCATNYAGEDCYDCQAGKYGATCNQLCPTNCGGGNSCDRNTGACSQGCDPGYTGVQCRSKCDAGQYGIGCSRQCNSGCAGPDDACHHVNGTCDSCPAGKYGSYDCSLSCSANCVREDNACDRDNGDCDGGCVPGYWGYKCLNLCTSKCREQDNSCKLDNGDCSSCDPGFYGHLCTDPCSSSCGGQKNECYQNNGTCISCDPGFYGHLCTNPCSSSCGGQNNECYQNNGTCISCDPGTYGAGCLKRCSSNCGGIDKACDGSSGDCDICPAGYYGKTCSNSCSIHCAGSQNACNRDTGECSEGCDPGYTGTTLYKVSRDRSPKSANTDSVEECSQQQQHHQQQQREIGQVCSSHKPPIGRPSQNYHAKETSPEYVDLYEQGFDHYDSPKEIMRRYGEYETPQAVTVSAQGQDYVEPETVSSAAAEKATRTGTRVIQAARQEEDHGLFHSVMVHLRPVCTERYQ